MIHKQGSSLDVYIEAVLNNKLIDIVALDVRELTSIADYFIICSGQSNRQVRAVVESIQIDLKKNGIKPLGVEGQKEGHWVVMDYGHVVIHIFYEAVRTLYDLEGRWADAKKISDFGAL
ncbi:MAG: ribosome silencing factor [Desulfobacterales bacterium]|nr:ribosome silencing factor [Desulfobacterales bacterium]